MNLKIDRLKRDATPYLLMAPAVLLTFLVVGYPVFYNVYISFFSWKLSTPVHRFSGLANYQWALNNGFWRIMANTIVWTVGCVALAFLIGFFLAFYVNGRKKSEPLYRGFLLLPWIIPSIIVVFIWRWMLQSDLGIVNYLLTLVGLIHSPVTWLSNENTAMGTVILVNTWKAYPFWFITLLAGLKSLPLEQVESAWIDGASRWDILVHIQLPHLKPVIMSTGILCTIWAINYVELIYALTNGGPNNATMILPVQSYILGFENYDFGRSSAVSTITLGIIILLILPYIRTVFRQMKEGENG